MISIQNEFPISKSIIQRVILGENYMSASLEGSKSNGGWLGPNLVTCEYLWPTWIPWFPLIHILLTSQIPLSNNLVPLPEKVIQRMRCRAMIINMRPLIWSNFKHIMVLYFYHFDIITNEFAKKKTYMRWFQVQEYGKHEACGKDLKF